MATSSFYLKVISANRVFFAGKCRSLIVPEFDGQKEILAHHEDMVIAIDEGQMKFQPEGSDEWIHAVVGMGFVEIVNNRVTLLVETAEKPEEIDVRRAEEAKQRAEERLRQKQSIHEYYHSRAALARAMAIRPPILILDDTTSALDMETEAEIQENLNNLDFECTKLIIAQRTSSARYADRIVILEDGRIKECGTHDELMKQRGYYYEIYTLQNGNEEEAV